MPKFIGVYILTEKVTARNREEAIILLDSKMSEYAESNDGSEMLANLTPAEIVEA